MTSTETENINYTLLSSSEKSCLELANIHFKHAKNNELAEIQNNNITRFLIFIDNNWSYLVAYDKKTLMCTVSGMLFDKESFKWVGIHNS